MIEERRQGWGIGKGHSPPTNAAQFDSRTRRHVLMGYSDSNWASSTDDRRFSLNRAGPLISWKSSKQPTVVEYIALAAVVQEGLYLTMLKNEIGEVSEPIVIFEDNQVTIALSKNPVNCQRSNHIDFISTVQNASKVLSYYQHGS